MNYLRKEPIKALVIGGADFIGSHLVDYLIAQGHEVIALDDLSHGRLSNLSAALHSGRLKFLHVDLLSADLDALVAQYRPDVIFHLGAQIDVRTSVENPVRDAEVNILATIRLAEAARKHGVHKVVLTSSDGTLYSHPGEFPVGEGVPVDPHSSSAASKYAAEVYLNTFRNLYGLDCSHIAPANVYGPRQNPDGEAGVVAIFAQRLLAGETTHVYGDGSHTRDYVYVGDVVRALYLAAGKRGSGMRFNIGTGVETTDRQLHTLVAETIGVPDEPDFLPARLGDLPRSVLSSGLAHRELGWQPLVPLREGIRLTVEHFHKAQSKFDTVSTHAWKVQI